MTLTTTSTTTQKLKKAYTTVLPRHAERRRCSVHHRFTDARRDCRRVVVGVWNEFSVQLNNVTLYQPEFDIDDEDEEELPVDEEEEEEDEETRMMASSGIPEALTS